MPDHRFVLSGPDGVIAERVRVADTLAGRLRGVLGRPLEPDEALLIEPCRQVHTFGVREALDVVFCDDSLRVVHRQTLRPRRLSRYVRRARSCIELVAGRAPAPGTTLTLEPLR